MFVSVCDKGKQKLVSVHSEPVVMIHFGQAGD